MNVVKSLILCGFLGWISQIITNPLSAQPLQLSTYQLHFGGVTEILPDSLPLSLSNPSSIPVEVTEIRFYEVYGQPAFSARPASLTIAPGDTQTIFVRFSPRHNILYNTEMVIFTDAPKGTVSVDLQGQGIFSQLYYLPTENKSEQALKDALKTRLAQAYVSLSYNQARDEMFMNIDNQKTNGQGAVQNTLECVYTGTQISNYISRSDAQLQGFNTEHTFPQSFFNENLPMRSDLFHLFPTLASANSERGNLPFGQVNQASWQMGGSKQGNGVFEARDVHKGSVARAMMYFVLRYEDYQNFFAPQEGILRQWHKDFPPTATNRKRNEDIYGIQGNRNPFIDYPQLLDRISKLSGNSVAPVQWQLDLTEPRIDFDIVAAQSDYIYHYVIVNTGNQAVDITHLSLTDSRLRFGQNTGNDATIQPGEALTVEILLFSPQQTPVDALFQFQTNIPVRPSVSLPVKAVVNGTTSIAGDLQMFQEIRFFPQPAHERLSLHVGSTLPLPIEASIWTVYGARVTGLGDFWPNRVTEFFLPEMGGGMYQLVLKQGDRSFTQKLWIK